MPLPDVWYHHIPILEEGVPTADVAGWARRGFHRWGTVDTATFTALQAHNAVDDQAKIEAIAGYITPATHEADISTNAALPAEFQKPHPRRLWDTVSQKIVEAYYRASTPENDWFV